MKSKFSRKLDPDRGWCTNWISIRRKKDDTMLDQLLTLVKHYKLRNQINERVHRMCDNLTPLRLHWTTEDKKHEKEFISEFELKYLNE